MRVADGKLVSEEEWGKFLAEVVDHVLHVEGGSATAYTGGYESFIEQREEASLSL